MPESVYVQRLHGPALWLAVACALIIAFAAGLLLIDASLIPTIFILLVLAATVAMVFMKVTIRVNDSRVRVSVIGFSYEVPLDSIERVSVGPVTGVMAGAGPRFIGNATAYVVTGPTVEITTRAASYLASAADPEAVVADINARRRLR